MYSSWFSVWSVLLVGVVLFAVRITGPPDLADDYHQERAAAYVMDALRNGNWICQYGAYGEVTSKPPMLTWLAALASLPFAQANWFSLLLPGALATLTIAALVFFAGERFFGRMAGFLAGIVYLMSPVGMKQIALGRIDGVFSATIMITALLGFRAWQTGKGWTWFWLAGAASTLTKGPFGVLLAGLGLLAAIWERRRPAGNHWLGIALFSIISCGWFWLAYRFVGQPLVDVMLGKELVGHAVRSEGNLPGQFAYLPVLYFLGRFAPWSLLAFVGFWRIWKSPAGSEPERQFERFIFCWFFGSLILFSLSPHQRPDLIFPLVPAGALIAGRELARFLTWKGLPVAAAAAAILVIGISSAVAKYHFSEQKDAKVLETRAIRELAAKIGGGEFPLVHVDSTFALQFYLNTKRPYVPTHQAAALLRQEPAVFVAVKDLTPFANWHRVAEWQGRKKAYYIVSNHPRIEWTDRMATIIGPARLELNRVKGIRSQANEFQFRADGEASVTVKSIDPVHVVTLDDQKLLAPGEEWQISFKDVVSIKLTPKD